MAREDRDQSSALANAGRPLPTTDCF